MPRITLVSPLAMACALVFPAVAHAQESGTDGSDDALRSAGEIVVTAQRREQRLQEVPIAVSAVSGESLARAGITDTRGLTTTMPSLVFSRANSSFQPYIRGVGTRNANVGDESNVAVYIDGVYQPVMSSLGFDLVNIERVEVLRGPQGTLFGRNATGGLINVITKDPTEEFSGKLIARAGSYGELSGTAYVSGGLMSGLKADLTYMRYTDSGFIKDLANGGHTGDRDSQLVRGRVLIEPNDRFQASITASYSKSDDQSPVSNQPLFGNTRANLTTPLPLYGTKPWQSALDLPRTVKGRLWSVDVQLENQFDGFTIQTTSSYQNAYSLTQTDNDGSVQPLRGADVSQDLEYLSNEIRVLSNHGGPFSWIGGVFFFDGRGEFNPLIPLAGGVPTAEFYTQQNVNSFAAFGEGTLELGPLNLIGGVRYTTEKRDFFSERRVPSYVPLVGLQKGKNDKVTFRGTAQFNFSPNANAYVTFSRGFKSGVFNGFATSVTAAQITRPETLDAWEFGIKSNPTPWLLANLSLFHYDYKDIQQSARDPVSSLVILFNAAKSKMKGGEVEFVIQPNTDANLRLFATYLDAKYDEFPGAQIFVPVTACPAGVPVPCGNSVNSDFDASGLDMIRAPEFTIGASGRYRIPVDFGQFELSANAYHSAKYYWEFSNRIVQPSYTMLNGEVSFATSDGDDALRIGVWVKNILDEVVYAQVLSSNEGDVVAFDRPRTFGVSISKGF